MLVDPTPRAWADSFSELAGLSKSLTKPPVQTHQKIITGIKNHLNNYVLMYPPANKSRTKNKKIFIPSISARRYPVKATDGGSECPSTLSWILDETLCSIKRKQDLQYSPAIHMRLICSDMNDMMDAIEQVLQKIDRDMMGVDLVQTRALPWRNLMASTHEFLNVTQATSAKAVTLCHRLDAIPEQPSKYGELSLGSFCAGEQWSGMVQEAFTRI